MSDWQDIETAPKTGEPFLAYQDGEVYVARYTREQRIVFRTHDLRVQKHHRVINVELDGETVEAHVPINQPWHEEFSHAWTVWTRGFEFRPTMWAPLRMPVEQPEAA